MIWRERAVLLAILGVLLAANVVYFFTYRVGFQTQLDDVEQNLAQAEGQLEQARNARLKAERTYQAYKRIERDVEVVFDDHWATERERLTAMIGEVKRLATASSLQPPSYGFTESVVAGANVPGRRRRDAIGATEVGIAFEVGGTYEQIRRLINLLELSRQFVIIDSITLTAREGQTLTLSLHLKTLFRDDSAGVAGNRS